MIEIRNVEMSYPIPKSYKEYIFKPFSKKSPYNALKPLSTIIQEDDKVAFLGANGAGKTTLLKLIGGLLYPSRGEILVSGFDTRKSNAEVRKYVGFVLNEERSFYWRLTGRQNLEFFGTLDNLDKNYLSSKMNSVLELVGLGYAADQVFAGYSSGMKQRLAIARGLLSDPPILILDEPTRTLDPIAKEGVKNLIKERIHQHKNRTLLIATHDLDEAATLCNRAIIMKEGEVLLNDSMSTILGEYKSLEDCYKRVVMGEGKSETALHDVLG